MILLERLHLPSSLKGRAFGNGLCKLASPGGKRAVFGRAAGLCLPLALAVPGFSHPSLRGTSQRKLMTNVALGLLLPVYLHSDPGDLLPVVFKVSLLHRGMQSWNLPNFAHEIGDLHLQWRKPIPF